MCLGPILECLLRCAWSWKTCFDRQTSDSKLIIFIIHLHMFRVRSLCANVHFFTVLLSCCMWFVFTSCVHNIWTYRVCSLSKCHCFVFVFGCVVNFSLQCLCWTNVFMQPWVWLSPLPLFRAVLYPPCAISVCSCVPFRVCVDISPDSALVPQEVFKPPDWISQI